MYFICHQRETKTFAKEFKGYTQGVHICILFIPAFNSYIFSFRDSLCKQKRKRVHRQKTAVERKERTSQDNSNEQLDISFKAPTLHKHRHRSAALQSTSVYKREKSEMKRKLSRNIRKTGQEEIGVHDNTAKIAQESLKSSQTPQSVNSSKLVIPVSLHESVYLPESSVLYNQAVALIQGPHHVSSSDKASGSKSATLPRKVVQYSGLEKPVNMQTLSNMAQLSEGKQQALTMETPYEELRAKGWSCMLESVSVPDTLNRSPGMDTSCGTHQGSSERTLLELSKSKPFPHPKAWFVSLEGKPAAQVCHSIIDLRKCHLQLTDSHDTSLDSGVDLNEQQRKQNQNYLKRNMAHTWAVYSQDADLSRCESATILARTPEELSLKNTHQSSSGTVSYLSEEKCDDETLYEGSECVPSPRVQRLRKARKKPQSTWHLREERPLMKLN